MEATKKERQTLTAGQRKQTTEKQKLNEGEIGSDGRKYTCKRGEDNRKVKNK